MHSLGITVIEFSNNGNKILTASRDKTIKLWKSNDFKHIITFYGHTDDIWTVKFFPDDKRFVSSGSDGKIKIWNLKTKKCEVLRKVG